MLNSLVKPFLDRWRLTALVSSALMLAIAHGFQTFGGYQPCTLCLRQREVYWVAAEFAALSMVAVRLPGGPRLREATCWILGIIFLVGCGIAVYHAGAEWKFWPGPTTCSASGASGVSAADMDALLNGAKIRPPACDQASWVFLGISMAGWNALVSLKLTILSALAALRERARR